MIKIPTTPYIILGTVTLDSIGVFNAVVTATNASTNETTSTTTVSSGAYVLDISNFTSGYSNGDKITMSATYQDYEGSTIITVDTSGAESTANITLTAITESNLISYTTVQYVWDELDGKGASDISATRIIRAVQRVEGQINEKTQTAFKVVAETDEVHTVSRYNIESSADSLDGIHSGIPLRADTFIGAGLNSVRVRNTPIISITSLSRNSAGGSEADSWTALTEQTGSSGDFIVEDKSSGIIDFFSNYPRFGKRSWKVSYNWGYDPDSIDLKTVSIIKTVERLATILAVRQILTTKSSGTMFDSSDEIRIGSIMIKSGAMQVKAYLSTIDVEINELWKLLGSLGLEII